MVAHTFNTSTREAEAGESLWCQPGLQGELYREHLSQKSKKKIKLFINAWFTLMLTYVWTLPYQKLLVAVLFIIAINCKQSSCSLVDEVSTQAVAWSQNMTWDDSENLPAALAAPVSGWPLRNTHRTGLTISQSLGELTCYWRIALNPRWKSLTGSTLVCCLLSW